MNISKVYLIIIVLCVSTALVFLVRSTFIKQKTFDNCVQAYIYAYPLVLMDVTQKTMTNNGQYVNTFINVPEFPTDSFKQIVRPNVDTLYSFAWLDLINEPMVLSVPDTHDRYYLVEFLDAWTNVFATVGKRTTGTAAHNFIIVGPQWKGNVPENLTKIQAPTNMVLLAGRTQTYGTKDYPNVHQIQAGYTITPLKNWSNASVQQPIVLNLPDIKLGKQQAPVDQVTAMDASLFYTTFAQALKHNPPALADAPMVSLLKNIDIEPGKDFDPHTLSHNLIATLNSSIKRAFEKIIAKKNSMNNINGWGVMFDIGTYGTNYLTRAMVAYIGIGANLPEDALYPTAFVDANNNPLTGTKNYRIHFDKDQLPPVNAFWSITLYNAESFLVQNSLNRYSLNDKDPLQLNQDGSLDMYVQHESPGRDKESNWLPSPENGFNLTMRLYWPKKVVLDGTWKPPAIEKMR